MKASRLKAVLEKARNAGQVEESVTIAGLDLVLTSLTAQTLATIHDELKDVSESAYAVEYQIEHVCRAIVEVDGTNLREAGFIEVDAPEPGAPIVKVERHQWLRDNLVSTWSYDMVQVAFRKVLDVIASATQLANAGVQFKVEAESDEEKFRRLLGDLKEAGAELPADMREAILREEGLLLAASKSELDDLRERAKTWTDPGDDAAPVEVEEPPAPPPRAPSQLVQAAAATRDEAPEPPAQRVPLNQTPIRDPVPVNLPDQHAAAANWRPNAPPPDQVHDLSKRSARFSAIAAVETDAVVMQPDPRVDQDGVRTIVDKPPVAGVNAKYVNPHARGLNPRSARR
jgi:hypothetical protein